MSDESATRKNGGPAFPIHVSDGGADLDGDLFFPGLSVRDYFAAKAMQGYLSAPQESQLGQEARGNDAKCAEWAYQLADAMLRERSK